MQYRALGASGVQVSPICLGTMTFGNPVPEEEAVRLVHAALDRGVNFIDTANIYEGYTRFMGSPGGDTESILGKALRGRRDAVVLATKVGSAIGPGPNDRGLSAAHILRELDNSLRRLQTDFIDLYLFHWPDKDTPLEESLGAMDRAVQQGKVRWFGASNYPAWQLCEMLWLADRRKWPRVVASQIALSLLRREYQGDLEFCRQHNVGVTAFQSLQGGLLTGKYRRGGPLPADSRAARKPEWMLTMNDSLFDRLEAIEVLAADAGVPVGRYALAWALTQPAVCSLIVGVTRLQHLEEAAGALEVSIPSEHLQKLDGVCPPPWLNPSPIRP